MTTNTTTEAGSKNTGAAKKDIICCPEFGSAAMQKFDEKEIIEDIKIDKPVENKQKKKLTEKEK